MSEKVMYYNKHNHPKTEPKDLHFEYVTRYVELFNKNGEPYLEAVETYNQFERTQMFAEQCKIDNIIAAANRGDLSMFQKKEPLYIDATGLPKTLAEAQNLVIRMKDEFYKMPIEIQNMFNNSPEMYVNTMGTKEFNDKMSKYNKKVAAINKAGSLEAYNNSKETTSPKEGGNE